MLRRDNIKPELNKDNKHLCSSSVPFTEFLFGNDADLSKQLKNLAEVTKVSKRLNPKADGHKSNGYMQCNGDTSKQSLKALAISSPHVVKVIRPLKI